MIPPSAWSEHGVPPEGLPPYDAISTVKDTGIPVPNELRELHSRAKFVQLPAQLAKLCFAGLRLLGVLRNPLASAGTHVLYRIVQGVPRPPCLRLYSIVRPLRGESRI